MGPSYVSLQSEICCRPSEICHVYVVAMFVASTHPFNGWNSHISYVDIFNLEKNHMVSLRCSLEPMQWNIESFHFSRNHKSKCRGGTFDHLRVFQRGGDGGFPKNRRVELSKGILNQSWSRFIRLLVYTYVYNYIYIQTFVDGYLYIQYVHNGYTMIYTHIWNYTHLLICFFLLGRASRVKM